MAKLWFARTKLLQFISFNIRRTIRPDQRTSPKDPNKSSQTIRHSGTILYVEPLLTSTSKLDSLLNQLGDLRWHRVKEIAEKVNLTPQQTGNLAKMLAQLNLIHYNEKAGWLKINPEYRSLLTREEKPLHKPAMGSIILPAKETITIQDTQITNLTDTNLELLIRTCRKRTKIGVKTHL